MSSIDEPPQDRLPVQTFVMEHDWGIICDAIRREIQRGGQVYYLHNRIDSIERTAIKIREMLDNEVTVGVAHGQMDKDMLASVMEDVTEGKTQVLVCTTIIETGIDIPNVNTLIIEDADKMGLAQLHSDTRPRRTQHAPRLGLPHLPARTRCSPRSRKKRLRPSANLPSSARASRSPCATLKFAERAAFSARSSRGILTDVGYDMYMKLLSEAVLEERGVRSSIAPSARPISPLRRTSPNVYTGRGTAHGYLPAHRALRTEDEADDLIDELIDRFGDLPSGVSALINVALFARRGRKGRHKRHFAEVRQAHIRPARFRHAAHLRTLCAPPSTRGVLKVEAGTAPRQPAPEIKRPHRRSGPQIHQRLFRRRIDAPTDTYISGCPVRDCGENRIASRNASALLSFAPHLGRERIYPFRVL